MSVKLDKTAIRRVPSGQLYVAAGRRLYVLQPNGPLDRTIDPDNVAATETLVEGFTDEALTVSAGTGPFSANGDGGYDVWFPNGSYDLYVPADESYPVTRWQPVAAGIAGHDADALAHPPLRMRLDAVESGRPAVDIREYASGFDFTGATDNSTQMQTAIDGAVADGRRAYAPGGTLKVGDVTLKSGLHLVGDPGFRTRLTLPALDHVGGIFGTGTGGVSADDIVLEDLFFDGQQQSRSVSCGNALLKAYMAQRWTLRRVRIGNGTSYGLGFQGYPGEADANKRGPQTDILMEQCWLHDNGWIGGTVGTPRSGTNNSSDNIDIKSSERVVLNQVYSAFSSDPCYDIRSRRLEMTGCVAEGGQGAGFDLDAHRPNAAAGIDDQDTYITVMGGKARGNLGSGMAVQSTTGESDTHVDLVGFQSTANGGSGYANNAPTAGGAIRLSIVGGKYTENTSHGLAPNAVEHLSITGATIRGNGGDGINANNQDGGAIVGNTIRSNTGVGVRSIGTSDNIVIESNEIRGNTGGQQSLAGASNQAARNRTDAASARSIASAASITLPTDADLILVTGTNTISNITRSYIGRVVRLWFASSLVVQHNNSSILLDGGVNLNATGNDILELVCVSVNFWAQTSPVSAN